MRHFLVISHRTGRPRGARHVKLIAMRRTRFAAMALPVPVVAAVATAVVLAALAVVAMVGGLDVSGLAGGSSGAAVLAEGGNRGW